MYTQSDGLRWRIESRFGRWGSWVALHPVITILATLAFSASLIVNLPRIEFDNSIEGFLLEDDPILVTYLAFRDRFGNDDRIAVAIRSDEIFSLEFVERLRALHDDLETNADHVTRIDSLINARWTSGSDDELIVEELFEAWPTSDEELAAIRERALSNPLYENFLLSADGTYTTISLELDTYSSTNEVSELSGFDEGSPSPEVPLDGAILLTGGEIIEAVESVREILMRHEAPDFPLLLAGGPVIEERLNKTMGTDFVRFLGLSIVAVAIILLLLFRRASGALLPLGLVVLALLATLGVAPLLGVPMGLTSQILPSLLLAVGVGDSVHILTLFYQHLDRGDTRPDAIAAALGHSGLAVLMTSLTTAAALGSFQSAVLAQVADLGTLAPIGILLALFYTVTLLPAALALLPIRPRSAPSSRSGALDAFLASCARFSVRRPAAIVSASVGLLLVSLAVASQIRFSHHPLEWFPDQAPLRQAMNAMNEEMRGGISLEIILETGSENGLHDPALLQTMDALQRDNAQFGTEDIFIGSSVSLVDVVKEINQALNGGRTEARSVPGNRQLIAQELLLFESSGSDDLEDFTDAQFSTGRMTLRAPYADGIQYAPLVREIERTYRERIGDRATVTLTGLMPLLMRTFEAMVTSMSRSYLIAIGIIAPLMIVFLASFRVGIISMFPNRLPIATTLAIMVVLDLPLDGFTLLIGSVALGLAVDDTIHFIHGFNRYYAQSGDSSAAVRQTLDTSGRALLVTTIVLCCAFLVFTMGELESLFAFGLLTSLTVGLAFLADVLLAPALMVLLSRSGRRKP